MIRESVIHKAAVFPEISIIHSFNFVLPEFRIYFNCRTYTELFSSPLIISLILFYEVPNLF